MWYALAFHPDQIKRGRNGRDRLAVPPMEIPEDRIDVARSQGWIMLGVDSDVMLEPMDIPAQSNPRRLDDAPRDHGEQ